MIFLSVWFLNSGDKMVLESQWYIIIIYWLPLKAQTGNVSVRSVYILLECSIQMWILLGLVAGRTMLGSSTGDGVEVALVKLNPCQVCAMWHWTVSPDFGR